MTLECIPHRVKGNLFNIDHGDRTRRGEGCPSSCRQYTSGQAGPESFS